MKIFNDMDMQLEEFQPIEPGKVKMYACGPTVYNYIHVGNARPIVIFDVLRRYLEYRGYEVTFVQNFTDVDDKIIKRANEEGVTSDQDLLTSRLDEDRCVPRRVPGRRHVGQTGRDGLTGLGDDAHAWLPSDSDAAATSNKALRPYGKSS